MKSSNHKEVTDVGFGLYLNLDLVVLLQVQDLGLVSDPDLSLCVGLVLIRLGLQQKTKPSGSRTGYRSFSKSITNH
jgi:hypothetical protein